MKNQFGLARDIPADVKRMVRQKCGFGCVICGLGIVQYEHVDPEYHNAKAHTVDGIALLCPQCHAKVTTKQWSKARVLLAMKSPKCLQIGYTREFWDFCEGFPELHFGGMILKNCPVPIQVQGYPVFSIRRPEIEGEPFLISGTFTDSMGKVSLEVKDNEWIARSDHWDVQVVGPRISIREARGIVKLVLRVDPPHALIVEKLDMRLGQWVFLADGDILSINSLQGGRMQFSNCIADNCAVGLSLN